MHARNRAFLISFCRLLISPASYIDFILNWIQMRKPRDLIVRHFWSMYNWLAFPFCEYSLIWNIILTFYSQADDGLRSLYAVIVPSDFLLTGVFECFALNPGSNCLTMMKVKCSFWGSFWIIHYFLQLCPVSDIISKVRCLSVFHWWLCLLIRPSS